MPDRPTTLSGTITGTDSALGALCSGLETTGTPYILLQSGAITYVTEAAYELGLAEYKPVGRTWDALWGRISRNGPALSIERQRVVLELRGKQVALVAWLRPVEGSEDLQMVCMDTPTNEDEHESEVLRIFNEMQEQADNLFALYQITQYLNNANEIDELCATLVRELERITGSDVSCLYLATQAEGLIPKVCNGLDIVPLPQATSQEAIEWFGEEVARSNSGLKVLSIPLAAEDRLVGLALLAHRGDQQKEPRFLRTVANEMGTALLRMEARQALFAQEQKLEAIVASTTDAIIQVGLDGRIRDFNPAAEHITGYSKTEALLHTCGEIFGCEAGDGCKGACPFAKVLAEREPIPHAEMEVSGKSGRRYITTSVAALDLGQEMSAAVGILRDISKQKQIEQMKADFLATVSHQLRTPLAVLRGYVDTLRHLELSGPERIAHMAGMSDTTDRLERLVAQILDVTRIEEGRMDLQREAVRMVDLVRVAITALPQNAYRSRIWAEVASDLPMIMADPQRLEQVIINLLDNALKYSLPTGQVLIRAQRSGGDMEVEILDEGIGVPQEDQESVFEKFRRGTNARDLQLPGTGLGLFICRSIVQAHGGEITLSDGPRGGTRVAFRLPLDAVGAEG